MYAASYGAHGIGSSMQPAMEPEGLTLGLYIAFQTLLMNSTHAQFLLTALCTWYHAN